MTKTYNTLALLVLSLCGFGCGNSSGETAQIRVDRLALPDSLFEISGLTNDGDGTLYAIADERGQVYKISFDEVEIAKSVSFGSPPIKADFEGLTLVGTELYGVTSKGDIYNTKVDGTADTVKIRTGLGKQCEFEGIAADPLEPVMWLLCKTAYKKKLKNRLTLYPWDLHENRVREEMMLSIKYKSLGVAKELAPSGLAIARDGQTFLLVAAKQQAYMVLSRMGELIKAGRLPGKRHHPQAEGVTMIGQTIFVADEGVGGPGQLSRYPDGF